MSKRRKRKRRYRKMIQIKSSRYGWTDVELIGYTKSGKMIIKFLDGTIAVRKEKKVRFHRNFKKRSKMSYKEIMGRYGKKYKRKKSGKNKKKIKVKPSQSFDSMLKRAGFGDRLRKRKQRSN